MKHTPKMKKFGYALFIQSKNKGGKTTNRRVGTLFNNSGEAATYRLKYHAHEEFYSIQAVRVNVEPTSQSKEDGGSYETK